ncbi:MAG: radical SAM protein [Endomicrobiia bacterium]|nr:radical SAM protein [Endomicrobiia bacterium]
MCYAMPGLVVEILNGRVVVDYFGERRRVRNDFFNLIVGDYVYAQGGFVVQRIPAEEAAPVMDTWKEYFAVLERVDLRLADSGEGADRSGLRARANRIRREHTGNSSCVHGIIEFSNHCRADCLYCGLRASNDSLKRYRMTPDEIVDAADYAVEKIGFKALVLQSGEDDFFDGKSLSDIISKIMKKHPILLIMSVGERDYQDYEAMYAAGARGALIRFETSNRALYEKHRPGCRLEDRLDLIRRLKSDGWIIMSGFIQGLSGQTQKDIAADIKTSESLGVEMMSFGPLVPHPATPLASCPSPDFESVLDTIARARILFPELRILVTTASETLGGKDAARRALLAGANSVMVNLTPSEYSSLYSLYPGRSPSDAASREKAVAETVEMLRSIGRAPSDVGLPESK